MRRIPRAWGLAAAGALVLAAAGASAQVTASEGDAAGLETADAVLHGESTVWPRTLAEALRLPRSIDLALEHRLRFEALDGAVRPGEPASQSQWPQRTRLRLGVGRRSPLRFLVELQDSRTSGVEPGGFTGGQVDHLDVLQLLLAATGHAHFGRPLRGDLHLGRMTLDVGSRRLVARNRTRNTTNAFDGIHLQVGSETLDWRLRAFLTRPVARAPGTFDDEAAAGRRFSGVVYENRRSARLRGEGYLLRLDDRSRRRRTTTLGARLVRPPASGRVDFEVELARQRRADGARRGDAGATHGELGYTFAAAWRPRLALQIDAASGDGEPADGDLDAFDPLFGTRRSDLVATGIFRPFQSVNVVSPGLRLVLRPTPVLRLQAVVRAWRLAEARGSFAGTGLQDPTGAAGRDLGTLLELRAQWDPAPWLSVDAGVARWRKGSYLDRVAGAPAAADASYAYVAPRVRF